MSKKIKVFAVVLKSDDYFIPDFSVEGKFENVMQIHSDKESAEKLIREIGEDWEVAECELSITNNN